MQDPQDAAELEAYWAQESSVDWAAAERRAEASYYERYDEDAQRDLDLHASLWPNGYGYCSYGYCRRQVYHDGDCIENEEEAAAADAAGLAR